MFNLIPSCPFDLYMYACVYVFIILKTPLDPRAFTGRGFGKGADEAQGVHL